MMMDTATSKSQTKPLCDEVLSVQDRDSDLQGLKDVQQLQLDDLWQEWELELANEVSEEEDSPHTLLVHKDITGSLRDCVRYCIEIKIPIIAFKSLHTLLHVYLSNLHPLWCPVLSLSS